MRQGVRVHAEVISVDIGRSLVRDGIVQLFCPKPHPADLKDVIF
jgi:hypothetical protein